MPSGEFMYRFDAELILPMFAIVSTIRAPSTVVHGVVAGIPIVSAHAQPFQRGFIVLTFGRQTPATTDGG